jgi:predicted nicotinamide N-methyase
MTIMFGSQLGGLAAGSDAAATVLIWLRSMAADDLTCQTISLQDGNLRLLQARDAAELPDDGGVEWAPLAPYWSVLWRSGLALGREVSRQCLAGFRIVELGCGMGVPSLAASRSGAAVLATDASPEALELLSRNASRNGLDVDTAQVDWASPAGLIARGPFDLVLAADVLYERASVPQLLALLPQLAPRVLLADPGRPAADAFLAEAQKRWAVETKVSGAVNIHELGDQSRPGRAYDSTVSRS